MFNCISNSRLQSQVSQLQALVNQQNKILEASQSLPENLNLDNVADSTTRKAVNPSQIISWTSSATLISTHTSQISSLNTTTTAHIADRNNPHVVTKAQVGLSAVNNTSDTDKPISTLTQSALNLKLNISDANTLLAGKQNLLISGTNIKTINGQSLLGNGNIVITGGGGGGGDMLASVYDSNSDGKVDEANTADVALSIAWTGITGKPTTFTPSSHTHVINDVTGLQTALDSKASVTHTHPISAITSLQATLDGKQAAGSYAATSHTHIIGNVTGLQSALDAKQSVLVSGTSIKTINGQSLLGSGNISISGSGIDTAGDTFTSTPVIQHLVSLTQAEYDGIVSKDSNTLYYIV